ncbi:Hypothetical predicted protein [Pelobates cultripes]|uniref:Endonuclease/exonuclease/phosphatase domain-containing protein n=1 Tax=Pelobates cultripes TaxID=61616 RepID=A0AAD1W402_PELCU|nr:Hypothetical predicted protein [Pelobates cultripes]
MLRTVWVARASVSFLQETHFQGGDAPALRDRRFPIGYFANHRDSKKAGVATLFASTVPFNCVEKKADPNWHLFLKGTIADRRYTFASVYAPNAKQHRFLAKTARLLEGFREGLLILAGDINVPMDPA